MKLNEGTNYLTVEVTSIEEPPPTWPEVELAICPYCGTTFSSLEDLFDHVERKHLPAGKGYYWCGFCGAEFMTLMELFHHWVDNHLDQLTSAPEVAVYGLPARAKVGDEFEVTHTFNLKEQSKTWYSTRVYLGGQVYKLDLMRKTYTAPDLGRPECFPGAGVLDHTGQYTHSETVIIPTNAEGKYSIVSRCVGYTLNKWGTPGTCSKSKKAEWVNWQKTVGTIYLSASS